MKTRLVASLGVALALLLGMSGGAQAGDKVKAVASFSHPRRHGAPSRRRPGRGRPRWSAPTATRMSTSRRRPMPRTLAASQILFVNGLGFEGWMDRLEKSSGFKGKVVVALDGREAAHHDRGGGRQGQRPSPTRMPGRTSPTASSMSPTSATR